MKRKINEELIQVSNKKHKTFLPTFLNQFNEKKLDNKIKCIYNYLNRLQEDKVTPEIQNIIDVITIDIDAEKILNTLSINNTIIHLLVEKNYPKILRAFLDIKKANNYVVDPLKGNRKHNDPPAFRALKKGCQTCLDILLNHETCPSIDQLTKEREGKKENILEFISLDFNIFEIPQPTYLKIWNEVFLKLPPEKKLKEALEIKNHHGETPFLLIVFRGHLQMANALIEFGVDLTKKDNSGYDAIAKLKMLTNKLPDRNREEITDLIGKIGKLQEEQRKNKEHAEKFIYGFMKDLISGNKREEFQNKAMTTTEQMNKKISEFVKHTMYSSNKEPLSVDNNLSSAHQHSREKSFV